MTVKADVLLDLKTGDLDFSSGELTYTSSKLQAFAQQVRTMVMLRKGEWSFDGNIGVPYQTQFFKKRNNKALIDDFMEDYIDSINTQGFVTEYSSEIGTDRVLTIKFSAQGPGGDFINIIVEA